MVLLPDTSTSASGGDYGYAPSEDCPVSFQRKLLDYWPSQAFQLPVGNDYGFSPVRCPQDSPTSSSSSRNLEAPVDSHSSSLFSEFITFPHSPSQSRSPSPHPTCLGPKRAAQSSSPTTLSSAPFTPSVQPHITLCGQCQMNFDGVESILKHIGAKHRSTGSSFWPCVVSNCNKDFKLQKDLRRHLDDKHFENGYTCPCGRRRRRDKHKSHIKHYRHTGGGFYVCQCGHRMNSQDPHGLENHLSHIEKGCPDRQPRTRGRPRQSKK